jgi:NTE family protein
MSEHIKIGLALGSGGARGLAHAGVLQVLEDAGLVPDVIAGTSMGAIVGGLYAEFPKAEVAWKRILSYVQDEDFSSSWSAFVTKGSGADGAEDHTPLWQDLFDYVQRRLIAVKTVTRPYVQSTERLRQPLENLFQASTFADLKIPFATVALDLVSGKRIVFKEGSLVDGIYASSCIPAIFPPLEREGMLIVDGGGPYRVPVEACRELGADIVVAVDIPAFEENKFSTGLDVILRSNLIARQRLNDFVLATADLVISPAVQDYHWADFRAGEQCRARGMEAAQEALSDLQRTLRQARSWKYRMQKQLAHLLGVVTERPSSGVE